jgi:hypothetical protein
MTARFSGKTLELSPCSNRRIERLLLGLTGERKGLVGSSENDNYNHDGRAGVSRIEIDAHGLVQRE